MDRPPAANRRHAELSREAEIDAFLGRVWKPGAPWTALAADALDDFLGFLETLNILIQQHNMKEEQMLYTMAQQHLSAESDRIVDMMQSIVVE